MALLPAAGAISMSQIYAEYGISNNMSNYRGVNAYSDGGVASSPGPTYNQVTLPSTNLSLSNFYNTMYVTRSLSAYNLSGINQSTYTWTNVSLGPADTNRVLVLITTVNGGGVVSNPSIAGVTPTLVRASTNVAGLNSESKIYVLALATGTTGTVQFTGSSSPMGASFVLFSLYNVSATPKASGAKGASTSFPTLSLAAKDIAIFIEDGDASWSGAAGYNLTNYRNGSGNNPYSIASLVTSSAGNYTATTNITGTGFSQYAVFQAA